MEERLLDSCKAHSRQQNQLREMSDLKKRIKCAYAKRIDEYRYNRFVNGYKSYSRSEP